MHHQQTMIYQREFAKAGMDSLPKRTRANIETIIV